MNPEANVDNNNYFPVDPNFPLNKKPEQTVVGDLVIMKFPDGSATASPVQTPSTMPMQYNPDSHKEENLALRLEESELREIGLLLKNSIEEDISSQESFFEACANLVKLLGLNLTSEAEKDSLPFKGASSVYSSAIFETLQSLLASVRGTIFKSSGMVDACIVGESNEQTEDTANRMKDWFNYYFDYIAKEFRKEAMQSAAWTFIAGSAYKKVYNCPIRKRPVSDAIPIEDFVVNNVYASHLTATRRTHILRLTEQEYQARVMMGMYRDIKISKQDEYGNDNPIQEQLNDNEGYEPTYSREDGLYVIYECHADYHIKGDSANQGYLSAPYIISIDEQSGQVLSVRRNWKGNDPDKQRIEYFVNYFMLTSLRSSGYGLVHYAGRLAEAATALKRQLINSGIYAN